MYSAPVSTGPGPDATHTQGGRRPVSGLNSGLPPAPLSLCPLQQAERRSRGDHPCPRPFTKHLLCPLPAMQQEALGTQQPPEDQTPESKCQQDKGRASACGAGQRRGADGQDGVVGRCTACNSALHRSSPQLGTCTRVESLRKQIPFRRPHPAGTGSPHSPLGEPVHTRGFQDPPFAHSTEMCAPDLQVHFSTWICHRHLQTELLILPPAPTPPRCPRSRKLHSLLLTHRTNLRSPQGPLSSRNPHQICQHVLLTLL